MGDVEIDLEDEEDADVGWMVGTGFGVLVMMMVDAFDGLGS